MGKENSTREIWLVFWLLLIVTAIEVVLGIIKPAFMRSEEHTSELQSQD